MASIYNLQATNFPRSGPMIHGLLRRTARCDPRRSGQGPNVAFGEAVGTAMKLWRASATATGIPPTRWAGSPATGHHSGRTVRPAFHAALGQRHALGPRRRAHVPPDAADRLREHGEPAGERRVRRADQRERNDSRREGTWAHATARPEPRTRPGGLVPGPTDRDGTSKPPASSSTSRSLFLRLESETSRRTRCSPSWRWGWAMPASPRGTPNTTRPSTSGVPSTPSAKR